MTQAATSGHHPSVIDTFKGRWGFLSNFSAAKVELDGTIYPTVEHAFQAAKVYWHLTHDVWTPGGLITERWRETIQKASTPAQAKSLGRQVPLIEGWEEAKVGIMLDLLRQKFSPGRPHLAWLLDTGEAQLIEGNTWGDTFWGVCGGRGANQLGKLLMQVRMERRDHTPRTT